MTVKEFVGAQATAENPIKFNIIPANANGVAEKLTVKNYDTFAPMEVLVWSADVSGRFGFINLFVG